MCSGDFNRQLCLVPVFQKIHFDLVLPEALGGALEKDVVINIVIPDYHGENLGRIVSGECFSDPPVIQSDDRGRP